MTKATIILPTTGDRGPLLKYSVGSVLMQTEPLWELFIIGDGVDETTKQIANELAASDTRIHFFDYPKHPRRGEEYRHQLLNTARGDVVCYLCDRDLMLSNHLSVIYELLQDTDFGHTLNAQPSPTGRFHLIGSIDAGNIKHRAAIISGIAGVPLSFAAHRLDAYHRLPNGWHTTPQEHPTDRYMWQQFLSQADISAAAYLIPTIVYLRRGVHPGLSSSERLEELKGYYKEYCRPGGAEAYQEKLNRQLVEDAAEKHIALKSSPFRRIRLAWSRLRGEWRPGR